MIMRFMKDIKYYANSLALTNYLVISNFPIHHILHGLAALDNRASTGCRYSLGLMAAS